MGVLITMKQSYFTHRYSASTKRVAQWSEQLIDNE